MNPERLPSDEHYVTTKALSVWNTMREKRVTCITFAETFEHLRKFHQEPISLNYVREGIAYLVSRGFVVSNGDGVMAKVIERCERTGLPRPVPLLRTEQDQSLEYDPIISAKLRARNLKVLAGGSGGGCDTQVKKSLNVQTPGQDTSHEDSGSTVPTLITSDRHSRKPGVRTPAGGKRRGG